MIKTYVLILSKTYPKGHPKAGQPTGFREKFLNGEKIHTIRANYELWRDRMDQVRDRKAIISIREWEGKPYRSKQIEIKKLTSVSCCDVQLLDMSKPNPDEIYWNVDEKRSRERMDEVAKNDGLELEDFRRWFFPDKNKIDVCFMGAIIHFTPLRY